MNKKIFAAQFRSSLLALFSRLSNLVKYLLWTVVSEFECDADKIDARFATPARTSAFSAKATIPSIDQSEASERPP